MVRIFSNYPKDECTLDHKLYFSSEHIEGLRRRSAPIFVSFFLGFSSTSNDTIPDFIRLEPYRRLGARIFHYRLVYRPDRLNDPKAGQKKIYDPRVREISLFSGDAIGQPEIWGKIEIQYGSATRVGLANRVPADFTNHSETLNFTNSRTERTLWHSRS